MDTVTPAQLEKPVLDEFSGFYLKAFNDMTFLPDGRLVRNRGFNGVERISIAEMLAYCEMFEIDEREQFFYNMRAADDVFMEWVAKAKT